MFNPKQAVLTVGLMLFICGGISDTLYAQTFGWSYPIALSGNSFFVDYPAIAVGRNGEIFVVWECKNQGSKAQLFYTHFDGQTWSSPVAITDTGKWDWTPDIAVDTMNYPHVVWGEYGSSEIYHIYFDGSKWSTPENVSQDAGPSYYPRIAIDGENRIHVVWHDATLGGYLIYYRGFDGSTWSATTNVSDTLFDSGFPHIAIDSKNNLHVTFHCPTAPTNQNDIFYLRCTGGAWSPIVRITADSLDSYYPDIATFHDDKPMIVWSQVLKPWPLELVYASVFEGTQWTIPASIEDTSESDGPSIAIDKWDNVHLVWQLWTHADQWQRILYSSRINGHWSAPIDLVGPSGPLTSGRPAIKTDGSGKLHVIWVGTDNHVYYTTHSAVTGVKVASRSVPRGVALLQNYPNPFNGSTQVRFSVAQQCFVVLKVFDILGREIKNLESADLSPAEYSVTFDGTNLATGVYILQLKSGTQMLQQRMLLIR